MAAWEQAWLAECCLHNRQGLDRLASGLAGLGIRYVPSRGNFLLAHIGARAAACNEFLLRQGVIVRPVANYGLPEYLRISVGTDEEIGRLLEVLGEFMGEAD